MDIRRDPDDQLRQRTAAQADLFAERVFASAELIGHCPADDDHGLAGLAVRGFERTPCKDRNRKRSEVG